MIVRRWVPVKAFLPAALLAGSFFACSAFAQAQSDEGSREVRIAAVTPAVSPAPKTSPYRPVKLTRHAKNHYEAVWGVDNLKVRQTASGNLIRFSYRVIDPARAKLLVDKTATPYMFGQRSRALLQIPVMNKVGQLRQTGAAVPGQEYWMVFSNKGNLVKPGDRVNVIVGSFTAVGLMVE
jgi:hypothetical protein